MVLSSAEVTTMIQIFQERLNHELTREAALRAFTMIALNENENTVSNKSKGDTAVISLQNLDKGLSSMFDLLKKAQRQLQLNTLECLEALTRRYSSQFVAHAKQIQAEVSVLMSDDL
jgi:hypothetical protein